LFGTILTWMAGEDRSGVRGGDRQRRDGAATGDAAARPVRRGLSWICPTEAERREIITVHLRKRRRDPAQFDVHHLAQISDGYTGPSWSRPSWTRCTRVRRGPRHPHRRHHHGHRPYRAAEPIQREVIERCAAGCATAGGSPPPFAEAAQAQQAQVRLNSTDAGGISPESGGAMPKETRRFAVIGKAEWPCDEHGGRAAEAVGRTGGAATATGACSPGSP